MSKSPQFYTVSQAAHLKNVSRATVYSAIERKVLKSENMLGRMVISQIELSTWHPVRGWQGGLLSSKHKQSIAKALKQKWAQRKQTESRPKQ